MFAGKYRINHPAIALFVEGVPRTIRTIPANAIIIFDNDEVVNEDGLVKVMWEDKSMMMLTVDLRKYGEKIDQISD